MRALSLSERKVSVAYYILNVLATGVWHLLMLGRPALHQAFVGQFGAADLYNLFVLPDAVVGFGLAAAVAWLVYRDEPSAPWFAGFFAGGQGYAFMITCGLTISDPKSYWGMLLMAFSAGTSIMFALRLARINILWGPFRFQPAAQESAQKYWARSMAQTSVMWAVFLFVIPSAIALTEAHFKLSENWRHSTLGSSVSACVFVSAAAFGLWAARYMCANGRGTPLPVRCAKVLVQGGPYAYVRNPMALGGIVQGIAVGTIIGSPLIVLYAVLGSVAWNTLVRPVEEEYLEGVFGEEYLAYMRRVRCWCPRVRMVNR